MEFLRKLFSSGDFMPHGYCYLWQPALIWLHVVSDTLIALAYFSIPLTLIHFVRRRRDVPVQLGIRLFWSLHPDVWCHARHGNVDYVARDLLAVRGGQRGDRVSLGPDRHPTCRADSQGTGVYRARRH